VLNRWSATAYTCLTVALYVSEPSHVVLTTQDRVRVDKVVDAGVERHGDLLPAGTNTVHFPRGTYVFRTGHDAQVSLHGDPAVRVVAVSDRNDKDDPPRPRVVDTLGDGAPDRVPSLTVSGH
jgi:hypothetical protein